MAMNNGFTPQAQEALRLAHEIVQQKRHNQLDVEHIMLALLKPQGGVVCRIIVMLGGDPKMLMRRLDDALNASPRLYSGYGGIGMTNIHISMRAQRVVSEAANEAGQMDDQYIGTEHLFLAVAGERGGSAARLLNEQGIDRERIYQALREIRSQATGGSSFSLRPLELDEADPYQRMLMRVIRLQNELAALQRDLVIVIQQTAGPGGAAATAPGDGEQQSG